MKFNPYPWKWYLHLGMRQIGVNKGYCHWDKGGAYFESINSDVVKFFSNSDTNM